jgi:hypothetical protein
MLLDENELNKLRQCAKSGKYTAEDIAVLKELLDFHIDLRSLLKDPDTSLDDVYRYLERDENQPSADRPAGGRSESLPDGSEA